MPYTLYVQVWSMHAADGVWSWTLKTLTSDLQISQLEAEIGQKEGEIQRMNRQMNRVGKDTRSLSTVEADTSDSPSSELAMVSFNSANLGAGKYSITRCLAEPLTMPEEIII